MSLEISAETTFLLDMVNPEEEEDDNNYLKNHDGDYILDHDGNKIQIT